jgi:hypothetical protein
MADAPWFSKGDLAAQAEFRRANRRILFVALLWLAGGAIGALIALRSDLTVGLGLESLTGTVLLGLFPLSVGTIFLASGLTGRRTMREWEQDANANSTRPEKGSGS